MSNKFSKICSLKCYGEVNIKTVVFQITCKSNALSISHPRGLTLGTYGGIARDLLTFVAKFWPRTGALDHFCTSEARYKGKDPRDL